MIKMALNKKVFIETYGCQMNEYDTELVRSILTKADYTFVKNELEADIVMLNTCAIRENAHRKVYGRVHDIRHNWREKFFASLVAKDPNQPNIPKSQMPKGPIIGLLGCMVTNLRKELLEDKSLNIDFIAGPDSYKRLPQLIDECTKDEGRGTRDVARKAYDVTLSEFETYSDVYPAREKGVNAWLAVSRGCNNFCTFCVVPYTRGRERSRSVENIVEEVRHLVQEGFKQVTLLGQNVNSYAFENSDFADLLEAVAEVEGIERIRFTSPHPKDFPRKLLKVIAQNPKLCKHIHLPLQAGNDRVLDAMNRTYTQKEYLDLVDEIRTLYPAMALSTDVIVGFPTETDSEFEDTIKVMEKVEFDSAFIFKYSERKGTAAERKFPDDVSEEKKTERIVRINELQKKISLKRNSRHIGTTQNVLIEQESTERSKDDFQGRTDGNNLVIIPAGPYKTGEIVDVKITAATVNVLRGEVFEKR